VLVDVNRAVLLAMNTGRVVLGTKSALESAKTGRAKLIILANNCPEEAVKEIEYYSSLTKIPLYMYKGSSTDLGVTCKKRYRVSTITVREPGESDIMNLVEEANV